MNKKDIVTVAVVWLLILSVWGTLVASGQTVVESPRGVDVSFNEMPDVHWMAESWRRGEFPLWNPHTVCGMPHLGYAHAGGLYLVRVALFLAFPYIWAFSFSLIMHAMADSALFYAILRRRGVKSHFAGAAAIIMIMSGSFLGFDNTLWMSGSMCGLLLAWLCVEELLRHPRLGWFLGAAIGISWCGVAGDVELLAYGVSMLGLLQLLRAGFNARRLSRTVILYGGAAAAGFMIMAALVLSIAETVQFSIRGPLMPYHLLIISTGFPWSALVPTMALPFEYFRHLFPMAAANSGLPPLYQGIFINGLIIWSLFRAWRDHRLRPEAMMWAFILLYITLREGEVSGKIIDLVPVLRSLRFGDKAILILQCMGLILAAQMLGGVGESGKRAVSARGLGIMLAVCGAIMAAGQPWCLGGYERYLLAASAVIAGAALLIPRGGVPPLLARRGAWLTAALAVVEIMNLAWGCTKGTYPFAFELDQRVVKFARTLHPYSRYAVFEMLLSENPDAEPPIFGTIEVASGANNIIGPSRVLPARVFLFLTQIYRRLIWVTPNGEKLLSSWSMTDPGSLDRGRMHLFNLPGPEVVFARDMAVPYTSPYSMLQRGAVEWKSVGAGLEKGNDGADLIESPSLVTTAFTGYAGDRISVAGAARGEGAGWLTLTARDGAGRMHLLASHCLRPGESVRMGAGLEALAAGGVFGVAWVAARAEKSSLAPAALDIVNPARPLQEEARFGPVVAYRNRAALPRAFIARSPVVISGFEAELRYMDDPNRFSPWHDVVLEQGPPWDGGEEQGLAGPPSGPDEVKILSYGPERADMAVRMAAPGFLVFTDSYFPGWRLEDETGAGRVERRIFAADCAFRAVYLSRGVHNLSWVYRPVPFHLGLWCGICSMALALSGLAWAGARRRFSGRA